MATVARAVVRARAAPPPAVARDPRLVDAAVVGGSAALAIALCLIGLTSRSLWLDEAATVAIAGQHGSALWSAISHDGGNMLGYYALMHVLIGWFGHGAFVLRLPSALAAGGAAAAVSLLALRVFDRRVAVAAGLLTVVSLPLVFWGQDGRGYALMVALVAGSFAAFAALVQNDRAPRGAWIAYVVLTALSVYASFVAVLVVPAQLVVLLATRWRAWRRVLSALAVCVVSWVPLAVLAATRGSGQLFWISRPSLTTEKQVILALTSAGFEPNFHPTFVATGLAILSVILLLAGCLAAARSRQWGALLAAAWLFVPLVLMWVESLAGQPIFTARNLLVSLPAVALLIGWWLARTRLGWAVLVVVLAARAVALAPSYGTSPENWRAATAYVLAAKLPGDCVAFYPGDASMPFSYYAGLPVVPRIEQYDTPSLRPCRRMWLVASHQGLPTGTATSRAHYARYVALRDSLAHEYGRTKTRAFGYASVIWVELFYGRSVVPTKVSALSPTSATELTHSSTVKGRPRT